MARIQPVILCGGSGTRLWPLPFSVYPKQFLCFIVDTLQKSGREEHTLNRKLHCPRGWFDSIDEAKRFMVPVRFRPAEVDTLLGYPTKAREKLGWLSSITFDQSVHEMVTTNLADAKKNGLLSRHGYKIVLSLA
jgi:hypothetical protein